MHTDIFFLNKILFFKRMFVQSKNCHVSIWIQKYSSNFVGILNVGKNSKMSFTMHLRSGFVDIELEMSRSSHLSSRTQIWFTNESNSFNQDSKPLRFSESCFEQLWPD